MHIIFGILVFLHGLVHIWYLTLSQGWVEYQPAMGWNGSSWLLTDILSLGAVTRPAASILFSISAILFAAAGIGLICSQSWVRPWLIAASIVSTLTILIFWDGSFKQPVEKGAVGLLIDIVMLLAALLFNWI